MDNTAKSTPPVNRPANGSSRGPVTAPRKKRPSALARFRKVLANVGRRADELLEIGYRFQLSETTRARIDVLKPGHAEPSYHVDFYYDHNDRRWRYRCDCEAFRFAENAQQWDIGIQPECKHGRRALTEFLSALRFVGHVRPLPPILDSAVEDALADPNGPQPRASFDANNPWPTKRAVQVAPAVPAWDVIARRLLQS